MKTMSLIRAHSYRKFFTLFLMIALLGVTTYFLTLNYNSLHSSAQPSAPDLVQNSKGQAIERFEKQFCGLDSKPHNNDYITEYLLPQRCEMPLGILVENNSVWYISTKHGVLGSLDLSGKKFKELVIPFWNTRSNPIDLSQTWDVEADSKGNIWFTDERQNGVWKYEVDSGRFSFFRVPERPKDFGTTYPVAIAFDEKDNIYFAGIRSRSLWFGNVTEMQNNSSKGINSIPLPIAGFKGIDPTLISTGSLQIDNKRNVIWASMLAFGIKGELYKYDIKSNVSWTYGLPANLNSPVGIVLDENGNPWVSDHGTSIFFLLNATNGKVTKFTTAPASPRISPGTDKDSNAYTLPYWIRKDSNGSFWFNEHTGNKIGKFDPKNRILNEYWIPTQNPLWARCELPATTACGISNALQFSIGKNNELWFSEWTENKLGMLNTSSPIPFKVSIAEENITVKRGETKEIPVIVSTDKQVDLRMIASSTLTPTGGFGNSTSSFSQDSVSVLPGEEKKISFLITPSMDTTPDDYTFMIGVENDQVSYMKAISVKIV